MGEIVKKLRESKGWSQEQLAEKAGLSRVTISLIETNKTREVLSGTVKALARALEVPIEQLFFA